MPYNEYNQQIGFELLDFKTAQLPTAQILEGNYSRLEKINSTHIDDLFKNLGNNEDKNNWTYLLREPITDYNQFTLFIQNQIDSTDPYFFAIVDKKTNEALGELALLRINIEHGTIEVGHIQYSNKLKRTRIATEVHFLLAQYIFETLGFRRYEWKCDALNKASFHSAQRLGFTFEGIFRQHKVYKNRNRDTAWFSMLDGEWPRIKSEFQRWLASNNFNASGEQRTKLTMKQ